MTEHERESFNDALHKLQVRDTELRIRRLLESRLNRLTQLKTDEQMPYLFKLEETLRG